MASDPPIIRDMDTPAIGDGNAIVYRTAQSFPLTQKQQDQNMWLAANQAIANYNARQGAYVDADAIQNGALEARHFQNASIPASAISPDAGSGLVPSGTIFPYAGVTWPATNMDFLLCDGRLIPNSEYPALYSAIGNAYGSSGGQFRVPDLRGRFLVGGTGSASASDTSRIDCTVGEGDSEHIANGHSGVYGHSTHTLTRAEMPAHTHDFIAANGFNSWDHTKDKGGGFNRGVARYQSDTLAKYVGGSMEFDDEGNTPFQPPGTYHNTEWGDYLVTGKTQDDIPGDDEPHANVPPALAINYLIKT